MSDVVLTALLEDVNGFTRTEAVAREYKHSPQPTLYIRIPDRRVALADYRVVNDGVTMPPPVKVIIFRRIEECDKDVWLYREQPC